MSMFDFRLHGALQVWLSQPISSCFSPSWDFSSLLTMTMWIIACGEKSCHKCQQGPICVNRSNSLVWLFKNLKLSRIRRADISSTSFGNPLFFSYKPFIYKRFHPCLHRLKFEKKTHFFFQEENSCIV